MSLVSVVLLVVFLIVFFGLVFLGMVFWFYVKALEEAHREGWDMPS